MGIASLLNSGISLFFLPFTLQKTKNGKSSEDHSTKRQLLRGEKKFGSVLAKSTELVQELWGRCALSEAGELSGAGTCSLSCNENYSFMF